MSGRPARAADPTWRLLRTIEGQRGRLALAALLGALAVGSSVGLLATSAYLISRAALQPPILFLQVAIVGVRAFGIGRAVFRYSERLAGHDAAFRGLARLRVEVYQRLEVLAPTGLRQWRRGDLLTRLVDDVDAALDLQLRVLLPFLAALGVGVGSVVLAWSLLPAAGVILLVALLLGGVAVPLATAAAGGYAERQIAPARAQVNAEIVTAIESAADLLALQAAPQAQRRVELADDRLTEAARRSASIAAIGTGLGAAVQGLAVVASLLAGTAAVAAGDLSGVLLATVVLLPLAAYEAVSALPAAVLALVRVRGSAARVFAVLDAEPVVADPADPAEPPQHPTALVARGLSATWPGAAQAAVRGVDLHLELGRRVAVVGPSGSGKSTLAQALLRFLPAQGELLLGELPYTDLSGDGVRTAVGMLAQDAHIFDTTIEENLRLARHDATADELAEALHRAGLQDWLAGLPEGLGTMVGRHGARLSGGQRQRLALARLLLSEHRFVILDEPTEHLDPLEAEQVLHDTFAALSDRGVLLITHNLQQALACDEALVLVDGRVVQSGPPAELAGGGPFARLLG